MKKRIKQLFSILLSIVLCSIVFPCNAITSTSVYLTQASAYRNDDVNISVKISSNSSAQACGFELVYDNNVLELVSATKGSLLSANPIINSNKLGKIIFSYATTSPITSAGSLLDITFRVKENAAYGNSNINCRLTELSDGNFNQIEANITNGSVNVIAPKLEPPNNITLLQNDDISASIIWNAIENATGYNLYLNDVLINDTDILDNSFDLYDLQPDTEYSIQISTLNYSTESDKSDILKLKTSKTIYPVVFVDWNYNEKDDNDESIISTQLVVSGDSAISPNPPVHEGYSFMGWDSDYHNVNEGLVIIAQYSPLTYTVSFLNYDDSEIDSQTVYYATSATEPEHPTREGYTFTGWDTDFSNVTSNLIVQALYEKNSCLHENTEIRNASVSACTVSGYSGDTYCLDCGELIASGTVIPATGHSFDDAWKSNDTVHWHECTACGEESDKANHLYDNDRDASCNLCGYTREVRPVDENDPQLVIESTKTAPGKEVAVAVDLSKNPGLAYLKLELNYDDAALELVSATNAQLLSGTYTTSKTIDTKPYVLQWMGADDSTGSGEIAVLIFRVKDIAEDGDYTVSLNVSEAYNADFEDVAIAVQDGTITVQSVIIGDFNGDGTINGKDGILCSQALAGWDVEYFELAADVNGDGKFNGKDGILLSQYLAGWDVVLG